MMCRPIVFIAMALLLFPCAAATAAEAANAEDRSAGRAMEMGQAAYYEGEWKRARLLFLEALRKDPEKVDRVRKYLALVKAGERSGRRPANLRASMERVKIAEIAFEELAVKPAVTLLIQKVAAATKGRFEPNVIFKEPVTESPVTLSLVEIPASEVLRYIVELSGNQAVYEPHAIVISQAPAPEAP